MASTFIIEFEFRIEIIEHLLLLQLLLHVGQFDILLNKTLFAQTLYALFIIFKWPVNGIY
jgi:hypothetical protein